jgi:ribosomal protein L31
MKNDLHPENYRMVVDKFNKKFAKTRFAKKEEQED